MPPTDNATTVLAYRDVVRRMLRWLRRPVPLDATDTAKAIARSESSIADRWEAEFAAIDRVRK